VNGRSRKVYSVTPEGTEAMKDKVKDLISKYHSLTDPFDLGISNLDKVTPNEALAALEIYHESLDVHEDYLKQRLDKVEEIG
jgi:DNA-binding PadR family transcriptional regulator